MDGKAAVFFACFHLFSLVQDDCENNFMKLLLGLQRGADRNTPDAELMAGSKKISVC